MQNWIQSDFHFTLKRLAANRTRATNERIEKFDWSNKRKQTRTRFGLTSERETQIFSWRHEDFSGFGWYMVQYILNRMERQQRTTGKQTYLFNYKRVKKTTNCSKTHFQGKTNHSIFNFHFPQSQRYDCLKGAMSWYFNSFFSLKINKDDTIEKD